MYLFKLVLIFSGYMVDINLVCPGFSGSYGNSVFSIVAAPVYFPTNGAGGFPFLHTLSSIYYL